MAQRRAQHCTLQALIDYRAMTSSVLITFDVDGTLIKSYGEGANRFHKAAFAHAFKEVYGATY